LPSYLYGSSKIIMKKYKCNMCGWIYDENTGAPDEGISPGTRWEDIPNDWACPLCGSGKEDFDMVEI
jgi:rubredoxin-NAD+ reductase